MYGTQHDRNAANSQEHEFTGTTVNCSAGKEWIRVAMDKNDIIATGFWFSPGHKLPQESKVYSKVGSLVGLGWNGKLKTNKQN